MSEKFIKYKVTCARERILLSAWDLFHENGIHDTSVDAILKKSETGKSQFYHYFKSKDGLIIATLEYARKLIKSGNLIGIEEIDSWDDLEAFFEFKLEKMQHFECKRICPIGRFAIDLPPEENSIRHSILLLSETIKEIPKEFFIKLKARGELPADSSPQELANLCESVMQGASILVKIENDLEPARTSFKHLVSYLKGLSVQPD